jgi:hypothetical protein
VARLNRAENGCSDVTAEPGGAGHWFRFWLPGGLCPARWLAGILSVTRVVTAESSWPSGSLRKVVRSGRGPGRVDLVQGLEEARQAGREPRQVTDCLFGDRGSLDLPVHRPRMSARARNCQLGARGAGRGWTAPSPRAGLGAGLGRDHRPFVTEWLLPALICPCGKVTIADAAPGAHRARSPAGPGVNTAAVLLAGYAVRSGSAGRRLNLVSRSPGSGSWRAVGCAGIA